MESVRLFNFNLDGYTKLLSRAAPVADDILATNRKERGFLFHAPAVSRNVGEASGQGTGTIWPCTIRPHTIRPCTIGPCTIQPINNLALKKSGP